MKLALLAAVVMPITLSAQQPSTLEEYSVDAGHSIVEFSIPFAFTRVKGRFTSWTGTILYDRANPASSSLSVVIDAKSIDTGWPHRDEHLQTSDFFDVEKYPKITFQSDRVRATAGGLVADGRLTMHGQTRTISLPIQILGGAPQRSPESGNLLLDATSTMKLARKDFGITGGAKYNSWFDAARAATMGDSVTISLEVEGWRPVTTPERNAAVDSSVARMVAGTLPANDTTPWFRYVLRGYAFTTAGNQRDAADAFTRAKTRYRPPPPSNEKFKQVDEVWWQLNEFALNALQRGQVRPALEVARVLAEIYSDNARAFVTLGRALAANGEDRASGDAFAAALRIDPYETRAMEWSRRLKR